MTSRLLHCSSQHLIHLWILSLLLLLSPSLFAQDNGGGDSKQYGSEFSFHVGSLLPNQIEGVTEILPLAGLRYGMPTKAGVLEMGGAFAHARGVDYQMLSLSVRADFEPVQHFLAIVYAGPDFHYYEGENRPREMAWGGHVGTGLMMHISDTLWFRSEMKFNMNPGTALYLGFGLVLRSLGGDSGGSE